MKHAGAPQQLVLEVKRFGRCGAGSSPSGAWSRIMILLIVSKLPHRLRSALPSSPCPPRTSLSSNSVMTGLRRMATNVAMYRTLRTDFLPPHVVRLTLNCPLSLLIVAPLLTKACDLPAVQPPQLGQLSHHHARHHVSDSGNAGEQIVTLALQTRLDRMDSLIGRSISPLPTMSQAMSASMWGRSTGRACLSRLRSELIISTTWRLLRISASQTPAHARRAEI